MSDHIGENLNDTAQTKSSYFPSANKPKPTLYSQNSNEKSPILLEEDSPHDFPHNQLEELLFRKSQQQNQQALFSNVVREFQFNTGATQPVNKPRIPIGSSQKAKYILPSPSEAKSSYRPQFAETAGEYDTTNFSRESLMNQSGYNPLEETFKTDFSADLSYEKMYSVSKGHNQSMNLDGTLKRNSAVKASGNAFSNAMKALQGKVRDLEDELKKTERSKRELANQLLTESRRFAQHELEIMQSSVKEKEASQRVSELEQENKKLSERLANAEKDKQRIEKSFAQCSSEKESLMAENRQFQTQLAENARMMADFIAREKAAQETHSREIAELKRREEAALGLVEQLKERIMHLEQDNAESKKIYKDHLQELVSKNEVLTKQLESCKNDYSQQIQDFESELVNIEESHNAKIREMKTENDALQEKVAELQKTLEAKTKENEELKGNLDKCFSQMLDTNSVSPRRQTQSITKTPTKTMSESHDTRYQTGKSSLGPKNSINDWHTPEQFEADYSRSHQFRSEQNSDWPSNQKPSKSSQVKQSAQTQLTPKQGQPKHSSQFDNSPREQVSRQQNSMASPFSQKRHGMNMSVDQHRGSVEPTFRNFEENRGSTRMFSVDENGDPLFMESGDSRQQFSHVQILSPQPLDLDEIMRDHQLIKGTAKFNGGFKNLSFGKNDFENLVKDQILRNATNTSFTQPKTDSSPYNQKDKVNKQAEDKQLLALVESISELQQEVHKKNREYQELLAKAQVIITIKFFLIIFRNSKPLTPKKEWNFEADSFL